MVKLAEIAKFEGLTVSRKYCGELFRIFENIRQETTPNLLLEQAMIEIQDTHEHGYKEIESRWLHDNVYCPVSQWVEDRFPRREREFASVQWETAVVASYVCDYVRELMGARLIELEDRKIAEI